MITFIEKFLLDGFEKGDFTYGTLHTISIAIMLLSIPIYILIMRNKDTKQIITHMKVLAAITLFFYVLRRIVMVIQGDMVINAFWPFYLCNVNTIFLTIMLLLNIQKGRDFFIVSGMSGAILMFVVPEGVFNDRYLTLQIFDSLLSHYTIFFVPIVYLALRIHTLEWKNYWQIPIGFLLVTINVEVLQQLLTGKHIDYLFIQGPIELSIFGIPQFYVMLFLALLYGASIYLLDYVLTGRIVPSKKRFVESKR